MSIAIKLVWRDLVDAGCLFEQANKKESPVLLGLKMGARNTGTLKKLNTIKAH